MRSAVITLASILCGASSLAVAEDVGDLLLQLKACSQKDDAPRLECLNQLSRRVAQPPASSSTGTDHWILSETTSPVDYSPLVTATTSSRSDSERVPSLLSISCRNGRTELVVSNNGSSDRIANDFMVAYRINDLQAVQQRWNAPTSGKGASFRGDVVSFLRSLPDQGQISIRVFDKQGLLHDGIFLLEGVSIVRERVAAACKWPGGQRAAPITQVGPVPAQARTLWKSKEEVR
jgi:hypothetical protein